MPTGLDLERNPPLSDGLRLLRYAAAGLFAGLMLSSLVAKEGYGAYLRLAAFEAMALAYVVVGLMRWRPDREPLHVRLLTPATWALAGFAFLVF